jgi:hypothetical protein
MKRRLAWNRSASRSNTSSSSERVEVDPPYPRATLQEAERMWLIARLAAMGNKRFDDVLSRYDSKQGGFEN